MQISDIVKRIESDLKNLEKFTATPGNGCTRFPFTREARQAVEFLKTRMTDAGLLVHEDAAGNVIGILEGENPELPCVMMGSHYDSVIHGGNYDGIAGVVNAVETARQLKERCAKRKRNFVAIGFCDEEGTRFGTGYFGSGAILGKYDTAYLKRLSDVDGITIYDAMKDYGLDPERLSEAAWKKGSIGSFIESHIEQGPILEREGINLGLVDCIVGIQRYMVTVYGRADHAGTTPMSMRCDAMEAAAGVISQIPEWVKAAGNGTVATVGYIKSFPGGINIVPERVRFSVDIRSRDNLMIEEVAKKLNDMLKKATGEIHGSYEIEEKLKIKPLRLSDRLLKLLEEDCKRREYSFCRMASGAGHDTLKIGQNGIPCVLVFVPSREGRSHCPEEWSSYVDLARAAVVTTDLAISLLNEE